MTEVVQVQAEARPAIDSRSTLVSHNVTAEEIDRHAEGPQLPVAGHDGAVGQLR